MKSKRKTEWFLIIRSIILILSLTAMNVTAEGFPDSNIGNKQDFLIPDLPLLADDNQVIIGIIAPFYQVSPYCTPDSPCKAADINQFQEQLSAQEAAYLQIVSVHAHDSMVTFYPVKSSDDTTRTNAILSLLSSGSDIIIEDIGSAYTPFMRSGALTDQISQILSQYPDLSYGGLIHNEVCNIDILPKGFIDLTLKWTGKGLEGKNAEYYLLLVDRDTGQNLGLGRQTLVDKDSYASSLSYANTGSEKVRSQLQIQSATPIESDHVQLSAQITPESVLIDDAVFFPEKDSLKEMLQPEYVTISPIQQKEPDFSAHTIDQSTDATGISVSTDPFLLISAVAPANTYTNDDTNQSKVHNDGFQWVLDLMASIRDQILKKTTEMVTKQPGLTEISGPVVISTPGNYLLTSDITATDEVIIDIRSSGITIDGNGHMIEGRTFIGGSNELMFQTGIAIDAGTELSDISITNIIISGTYQGIKIGSSSGVQIKGCTVYGSTDGIVLDSSEGVLVDTCLISENGETGIVIDKGRYCTFSGNTIEGGVNGITIRDSENISLVSNEITDTVYDPVLEEGTNKNIVITDA
ncbi:MAG: right-handed parallel beta-helix repeat-containing protein [Methanospirillaceae archaeon]|nr:right-handed parallel beta-helix repeat-containing protein [Methanospirillaceae archaeon]